MNYKVYLSGHLKEFSNGQTEIGVGGNHKTVGDILATLWREHLSLRDRVLTEQGEIRPHVNIYYHGNDIRSQHGLQTQIVPGSELYIFNAISGG
jgi:molybdopterin converting factor small subunit